MTASVPRRYYLFLTIISAVLIGLSIGIAYKADQSQSKLTVSGKTFQSEVVDTDATRARGLSGRDSLSQDSAMLFVFDNPEKRCFWMKDMKFNIDIVWLDASKKVVGLQQNVSPASYPNNYCSDNSQYVVEFAAGTTDKLDLKNGSQFSW